MAWKQCKAAGCKHMSATQCNGGQASAKINISYSILFNLTTSYFSYFGGKKGISRNKTSFFLLMLCRVNVSVPPPPSVLCLVFPFRIVRQENSKIFYYKLTMMLLCGTLKCYQGDHLLWA